MISICHNGYFQEEEKLHEISFDDTLILTEAQNMGETIMDALIGELSFISYSCKVGCVFLMTGVFILSNAEFGLNDHREDAFHFIN